MSNSNFKFLFKRLIILGVTGLLLSGIFACNVLPMEQISSLLRDLADKVESPETQSQEVEQGQAESSESQTQVEQLGNSSTEGECSEYFGKIIFEKLDPETNSQMHELIILDENGGNIIELPGDFAEPAWSPNHCRIAFSANNYNYIRDEGQTGQSKPQIEQPTPQMAYPTLQKPGESQSQSGATAGQAQPDQSQSESGAFVDQTQTNQSETNSTGEGSFSNVDIYTMDPDGTDIVRLTDSPRWEQQADWSPDGKQIVYESGSNEGPGGIPVQHIHIMNADGSDQHLLSDIDDYLRAPEWSPDGNRIVFECRNPGRPATGTLGAICVIEADGKNLIRLTPTDKSAYTFPSWSPDGKMIALSTTSFNTDGIEMAIMNSDGSELHQVHTKGLDKPSVQEKKWSPDGKKLVFEEIDTLYMDLWVVNIANNESYPLMQTRPAIERYPDW